MKLSFDDKESFMEAVGSLRFNNPPSDPSPNTTHPSQQVPVGTQEESEDIGINNRNSSNDPNTTLQRTGRISEEVLLVART
jgi:hypothetical protein